MKHLSCIVLVLSCLLVSSGRGLAQTPQPDPKSPQYRATGEQDRSYSFPGTGENIAYHVYVPTKWTPASRFPLDDDTFPYDTLRTVPVLVIHGDADTSMVFSASQAMVEHAKAKGVDAHKTKMK
jgi:hypothetical protein